MIKQQKLALAAVGFLPLSLNVGCTPNAQVVETKNLYATSPAGFSQAVKSGNLLFTSGTVAWDAQRNPLPNSFEAQLNATIQNLSALAKEGGSSMEKAILLKFYVVNLNAEKRDIISRKLQSLFPNEYKPASSLLGVSALATEELLVEIELVCELHKTRPQ